MSVPQKHTHGGTSKDISDLPYSNKCILGVTSLWMILPVAHAMLRWRDIDASQKAVVLALCCACCSSTMFWFDARRGSLFHKLDKLSAVQYVVSVMFATAKQNQHGMGALLLVTMMLLFLLGDMCFRRSMYRLQLTLHLLFRYVAYWWGHILLVPAKQTTFLVLSAAYFGHVIVLLQLCLKRKSRQDFYGSACLMLLILVCSKCAVL